jgi:starch phosphorylase
MWENIEQIPDEELWRAHQRSKAELVSFARKRLKKQMQRRGTYHTELNWAEEVLDPEALTIGFARRFATYKRGGLILKDPKRLVKMLNNTERPLQLVFAGKAHPKDSEGKEIIRQIIHFASHYNIRRKLVFLEDYDINVAGYLVKGVDVWLNNPRPPMEASGTSGMKAALNGALNLSAWDGWWCEGYVPDGGWVIGSGESYDDIEYQDMVESQAMYNILENEVIPLFYSRTADNLPRAWIYRMKKTMQNVTPKFNTDRMVAEYTRKFYKPASERWNHLVSENMKVAKDLSRWKNQIYSIWKNFSIEDVNITVDNGQPNQPFEPKRSRLKVGSELNVKALVKLPEIKPEDVDVQLYYGNVDTWSQINQGSVEHMKLSGSADKENEYWFTGSVRCQSSGRQGVTVRILPKNEEISDQCELGLVLWEGAKN